MKTRIRIGGRLRAAATPTAREQVAAVAALHQPDEPAYGITAWDAEDGAVLWVTWDGTSNDEIAAARADWLEIPEVTEVRCEAEALPSGWWNAEVVYPQEPPRWTVDPECGYGEALELARQPLPPLDDSLPTEARARMTAILTPKDE